MKKHFHFSKTTIALLLIILSCVSNVVWGVEPTPIDNGVVIAAPLACPGCCSGHGGVSNSCGIGGRIRCNDGTTSPSCLCSTCGVSSVLTQSISFSLPSSISLSTRTLTLNATASSGLTVRFSSNSSTICTVTNDVLTLLKAGVCSVSADQAGNGTYGSAPTVTRSINVTGCSEPVVSIAQSVASPSVRDSLVFSASSVGGVLPHTFIWDLDGDGATDSTSANPTITTRYNKAQTVTVRLRVTDAVGCSTQVSRQVQVLAPELRLDYLNANVQQCGNDDSKFDPGEVWRIRSRVTNFGADSEGGFAQFVASGSLPLIVLQGAGQLGNLSAGQSTITEAIVKFPESSSCGANLGLNYSYGLDAHSAKLFNTKIDLQIPLACNVVNTCQSSTGIVLRGGSFYNPNRGGNGLVSFVIPRAAPQVPLFFGAWFTGESDRNPTFYIISGDLIGNAVSAQILKTKRDLASPGLVVRNVEAGTAQISFISSESLLFSYQFNGNSTTGSNINRSGAEVFTHLFKGLSPALPNVTGHYYNPNDSGWGQTYESYIAAGVAQQFIITYIYDSLGEPRWLIGNLEDSTASGPVNTYQVHCPGCAWLDIGQTFKAAGTLTRSFPSGFGTGVISTQFDLPAPLSGRWIRNGAPIQALSAPQSGIQAQNSK